MIRGIDLNRRFDFVSKFDTSEPKTIFKIGYVDVLTLGRIQAKMPNDFEFCREVARCGIKDFQNLKDSSGNEVVFKSAAIEGRVGLDEAILKLIHYKILFEIAAAVMRLEELVQSEEESANDAR